MSENYKELMKQIESLQAKAVEAKKRERQEVISRAKALIQQAKDIAADYEISLAEIGLTGAAKTRQKKTVTKKVAPKFVSPDGVQSWTGRGMKPRWFVSALQAGKTEESMRVKEAA